MIWLDKLAKIRDRNPKNPSGGYDRLFSIPKLGTLITKVHSASISAGRELERLIRARVDPIEDLDAFLRRSFIPDSVSLATEKEIKRCTQLDTSVSVPDFIIFEHRESHQHCRIVELKDGHVFDAKKVNGERRAMQGFIERNSSRLPYEISIHFCAFNQEDRQAIWEGFKKRIDIEEAMTGREFCELLGIDYDELVEVRSRDTEDNTRYFIEELLKIPQIKRIIENILGRIK